MYNDFFGFKAAPFSIAPDPRYLYMTAQHRDALAHLVYGFNSDGGCILLTGEVGTGKTTICRCLLEQVPDKANVALVLNPKLSEIELLETVCDELKIDYPGSSTSVKTYTDRIYDFLIESNRRNEKTVLIIDEAQNLNSEVLEQLRLLTNLETDKHKLLQIIILGQPELLDILASKEMRQLAQRITARFHLHPLSRNEMKAYISHRLAVAGQNIQLFPESSINLIYRASKGVPRLINIISDRALLGAYVENRHQVDPAIVKKACREVFGELKQVEDQHQLRRWAWPALAITVAICLSILALVMLTTDSDEASPPALATAINQGQAEAGPAEHDQTEHDQTEQDRETDLPEQIQAGGGTGNSSSVTGDTAQADASTSGTYEPVETDGSTTAGPVETVAIGAAATGASTVTIGEQTTGGHILDDIDSVLTQDTSDNSINAYTQLFKRWGQDYDHRSSSSACRQATRYALGCLHRLGNINSLKTHNRPAVLTLVDKDGSNRYLTITHIEDDVATVVLGNHQYQLPLSDIDRHWYGKFTILWHRPEHYSKVVSPGDRGDIINWLQQQFNQLGMTDDDRITSTYDETLLQTVKRFQQDQGLVSDGIVGPLTIIHLNTVTGRAVPSLLGTPDRG